MAFRQSGAIWAQIHGQMSIDRWFGTKHFDHVHLAWCVIQMVVTADDVSDIRVVVIDDDREIIGWRAIRTGNDQIVELRILEDHPAPHLMFDNDFAVERILKADDWLNSVPGFSPIAATAVVPYMPSRMASTFYLVERSLSVSSIRSMKCPPWCLA